MHELGDGSGDKRMILSLPPQMCSDLESPVAVPALTVGLSMESDSDDAGGGHDHGGVTVGACEE